LTESGKAPVFMLHCRFRSPLEKPIQQAMSQPPPDHTDFIHSEEFLRGLIKRQLRLSVSCASAFLLLLFGLPVMNFLAPTFMAQRVGGFTLSWLILGVLFFPYVWIIAKWFIVRSIAMENTEVENAAEGNKRQS
jgi:uncharacterized membrane protein (DUF485 family)